MPSLYTVSALLGGSALIAWVMMADGTQGQNVPTKTGMSFSSSGAPILGQFGAANINASDPAAEEEKPRMRRRKKIDAGEAAEESSESAQGVPVTGGLGGMGSGGIGGGMSGLLGVRTEKAVVAKPTSRIALKVMDALDRETDFQIATTLENLPKELGQSLNIPVLIDDRGVALANQKADTAEVVFSESGVPLRTALRRMLHPLGLKAVVEDEGLVITADAAALVHQGIGTSHWINIDQDAEAKIAATLDSETNLEFAELPLTDAIEFIIEQHHLPILFDRRAMDEIGLSVEEPVSLVVEGVLLRNALSLLLRDFDLTYTVYGESLVVTTAEASEQNLLNRIYWLEGTGFASGDYQSVIDLVQSSIVPDAWDELGGPSTISPVASTRPAVLVSTTYAIHQQIDTLLKTLRDTHFGSDPVLEEVRLPAKPKPPTMGGGGMF